MTVFRFFKMVAVVILDFYSVGILGFGRVKRVKCMTVPNFTVIGQTAAEMAIFRFLQDGGQPPSWICDAGVLTILEGHLYHCAKFGWNRCSSFDNYSCFSISRVLLENAYSRPKNWGGGLRI